MSAQQRFHLVLEKPGGGAVCAAGPVTDFTVYPGLAWDTVGHGQRCPDCDRLAEYIGGRRLAVGLLHDQPP